MKRHISPLSRHLSDAYKDVRGVKVTMKEGKYALHRPCCLLYTDANMNSNNLGKPLKRVLVNVCLYLAHLEPVEEVKRALAPFLE